MLALPSEISTPKLITGKLWVNPDCGLKTRGQAETAASLQNMVAAARQLRYENS
ncbi:hypothetical protein HCH52_01400 [Oscillospiraceae bacterium HV4-5-C5C]|nr:hypothetical protein [Oscillospiraceae bacterium HV4-5-C5C]